MIRLFISGNTKMYNTIHLVCDAFRLEHGTKLWSPSNLSMPWVHPNDRTDRTHTQHLQRKKPRETHTNTHTHSPHQIIDQITLNICNYRKENVHKCCRYIQKATI